MFLDLEHENCPLLPNRHQSNQCVACARRCPFGVRIVAEKRDRVYAVIEQFLAVRPRAKIPHPRLGLSTYPISRTPFVVLYDFDETELRIHFVFHRNADLRDLDPATAEW